MLVDHEWKLKYTPEDGNLVRLFYLPALEDAKRYDRLTGYFRASALTLAARGIEGLVRTGATCGSLVGCTLGEDEIKAIEEGESLRRQVGKRLTADPLAPPDAAGRGALELLSWMVEQNYLDVRVAVPCDGNGKPVNDGSLFHEKTGIIEDRGGDRIAWTGSLNETATGWVRNWKASAYSGAGRSPIGSPRKRRTSRSSGRERSTTSRSSTFRRPCARTSCASFQRIFRNA